MVPAGAGFVGAVLVGAVLVGLFGAIAVLGPAGGAAAQAVGPTTPPPTTAAPPTTTVAAAAPVAAATGDGARPAGNATSLPRAASAGLGAGLPVDADAIALARKHTPILMVAPQSSACRDDGERWRPMPVDLVLDNPEVALRQVGDADPVVRWAPSAADLYAAGPGLYLDLPGRALSPGCLYEQDARRFAGSQVPTIYAHLVAVPATADEPALVVLQYWFWWYFNEWNNLHESDWEGIQLVFEASSAAEALAGAPRETGYAQHEGGERAAWDDDKLEREGDRPVVYPSTGSHGSYYTSTTMLGRGASEGFGCDRTEDATVRVDPAVEVLPHEVTSSADRYAWLGFAGRWGERGSGPFDGPNGLTMKGRWYDPMGWQARTRASSVAIGFGSVGVDDPVVGAFCSTVAWASTEWSDAQREPMRFVIVGAVLLLVLRWLVGRTTWAVVPASPIVARRRTGEIFRAALAEYRRRPLLALGLTLLAVPALLASSLVLALADRVPAVGPLIELGESGGALRAVVATASGGVALLVAGSIVTAATALALHHRVGPHTRRDTADAARSTLVQLAERIGPLAAAIACTTIPVLALAATGIGAPVALVLAVRWMYVPQVVVLEGLGPRAALARSAALVRGRWLTATTIALSANIVLVGAGFVVALVALATVQAMPLASTSLVASAIDLLVMPWSATVLVLAYGAAAAAGGSPGAAAVTVAGDAEGTSGPPAALTAPITDQGDDR